MNFGIKRENFIWISQSFVNWNRPLNDARVQKWLQHPKIKNYVKCSIWSRNSSRWHSNGLHFNSIYRLFCKQLHQQKLENNLIALLCVFNSIVGGLLMHRFKNFVMKLKKHVKTQYFLIIWIVNKK